MNVTIPPVLPIPDVSAATIGELISLKGRTAVVTGAAAGLGRAIAHRLAEAGANVLIGDIDLANAALAAREIADAHHTRCISTLLDVRESASIAAAADLAVAEFGGIDIWVNNAGIYPLTPLLELGDDGWDKVVDINLRGAFIGGREAAKRMVARGKGGVIINMSSTSGFCGGNPGSAAYVASKHGVNGITKLMALELADHHIRVLAVAPTLVVTEGVQSAMQGASREAAFAHAAPTTPLGRLGVPDDVARVVLFCASDLALFMTGSALMVDAGNMTRLGS